MGVFNGKNYLVGASDNGELIFYSYDGKGYSDKKHLKTGVSGKISISIKDMNMDKKNEIFLWSPENDERQYPVMAAYDVSGENMKTVWDGGRYFVYDGRKYTLSMDDAADVDNDGKLEAYMLPKKVSGQDGSYSIFIFSNDKTLLMANDFMRTLSLSTIK
jgi:hypothetical protein